MKHLCRFESLEQRTLLSVTPLLILQNVENIEVHDADTAMVTDDPNHGTLNPTLDNSLRYVADDPPLNDFFAVQWGSGGAVDVSVMALDGTAPSIAVDDSYTLPEDWDFVTLMPGEGLLANDTINGANPVVNLVGDVTHGDLLVDDDGSFIYLPDPDFNGSDLFVYDVTTDEGSTNLAFVTLTVTPVNDAPDAVDDSFSGYQDEDITGNLLDNDFDIDGDILTALKLTDPSNGAVVVGNDGAFTYTPNAGWYGEDSFTYQADDGNGGTDSATVTLTVEQNDPPVAIDDSFTMDEDLVLFGGVGSVAVVHEFTIANTGSGDLLLTGDPLVQVTGPNASDFTVITQPNAVIPPGGSTTFEVSFMPTGLGLRQAELVVPNNDPDENPYNFAIQGMGTQDYDPNGDSLTYTKLTDPANGTLEFFADGTFNYTPNADWNGQDTFTYEVSDGKGGTATGTATIDVLPVNDRPEGVDDTYSLNENETFKVKAAGGVLANDSDIDGDPLEATVAELPAHGHLVMKQDGGFMYRPDRNFVGQDSFTYVVDDGVLVSSLVTVTLNIGASANPVARSNLYQFSGGALGDLHTVTMDDGVLANDYFVRPGDPFTGGDMSAVLVTPPAYGDLVLDANGSFTYTLTAAYEGLDSFVYHALDEATGLLSADVAVTLLISNPVAPASSLLSDGVVGASASPQIASLNEKAADAVLEESDDTLTELNIDHEIGFDQYSEAAMREYLSYLGWSVPAKKKQIIPPPEYMSYYDYLIWSRSK